MIWVDWAIITVLLVSSVLGLIRGMVREIIALTTWVGAILAARMFGPKISEVFMPYIDNEFLRQGLGFALTAVVVVILGSMVSRVARTLVSATGLGGFDRIMGFVFGGLRGVAILVVLIAVVSLTSLKDESWWSQSQFIPMLEDLRDQAAGLVDSQIS